MPRTLIRLIVGLLGLQRHVDERQASPNATVQVSLQVMGSIGLGLWKMNAYGIEPLLITARGQTRLHYFNLKAHDSRHTPGEDFLVHPR